MHSQRTIKIFYKTGFRKVITGGTKASGNQNDVCPVLRFSESSEYRILFITHRSFSDNPDPCIAERDTHPLRIGVNDLSVKDLITDG
jgi:hypothetical protein